MSIRGRQEELFEVVKGNTSQRWSAIREIYRLQMNGASERDYEKYFLNWDLIMSPIEKKVWADLRYLNLPFYPQFPVARYFVDFGDPWKKFAIECDGKDFHDPIKDQRRDAALMELGWTVFRFSGSECNRNFKRETSAFRQLVEIGEQLYGHSYCLGDIGREEQV